MKTRTHLPPATGIETSILTVRGEKVLLDRDLTRLYGVPTKALNQAVKRNPARFPVDFLLQLTPAEKLEVVTNCDHLPKAGSPTKSECTASSSRRFLCSPRPAECGQLQAEVLTQQSASVKP